MDWLINGQLAIPVDPSSVHFIKTPSEFHSTLKNKIANSKKQIIMVALYLGNGSLELDLINVINKALVENSELELRLLFDYFRSSRAIFDAESNISTVELLKKLKKKANIKLFYHPDMCGMIKHILPERINELIGVQHMKFFIFDDCIIISGANLSYQYFVNRQDRYMKIENNPLLVDFFVSLFEIISSCSLNLDSKILDPKSDSLFRLEIFKKLSDLFETFKKRVAQETLSKGDTYICPLIQMGTFFVNQEMDLLSKLFTYEESDINVTLSTGYFNLYENYAETILKYSKYPLNVLLASPKANGFYGASGLSAYVPSLYVHSLREFYDRCKATRNSINFYEYTRPNWSFHAKGLWIETIPHKTVATVIGSSNYGYRSTFRDLEAEVLLVTEDGSLIKRILEEKQHLMENSNEIDLTTFLRKDYFVPGWIKYFSRIVRNFF